MQTTVWREALGVGVMAGGGVGAWHSPWRVNSSGGAFEGNVEAGGKAGYNSRGS